MSVAFRPAEPDDLHFIVSGWASSLKTSNTAGMIQDESYYPVMNVQIEKAMNRPDVRTIVACKPNETDHVADLYGFITADTVENPPLVYFVYAKQAYRRASGRLWSGPGIARGLFAAMGINPVLPFSYVCSTPVIRDIERKIPMARWRPLDGRYPKATRRERR